MRLLCRAVHLSFYELRFLVPLPVTIDRPQRLLTHWHFREVYNLRDRWGFVLGLVFCFTGQFRFGVQSDGGTMIPLEQSHDVDQICLRRDQESSTNSITILRTMWPLHVPTLLYLSTEDCPDTKCDSCFRDLVIEHDRMNFDRLSLVDSSDLSFEAYKQYHDCSLSHCKSFRTQAHYSGNPYCSKINRFGLLWTLDQL